MSITQIISSKAVTLVSACLPLQTPASPVAWCPIDKLPSSSSTTPINSCSTFSHLIIPLHHAFALPPPWAPLCKNFVASPCHCNTSCITLHQPYSHFTCLFVGTNFTCHCSNSSNQSIWFTLLCPTLTTLQSTYSIQCATILFLDTTTFSSTISTIHSQ